ncbi:hypothetical protein Tco_0667497 [Tanacetum coccineum]
MFPVNSQNLDHIGFPVGTSLTHKESCKSPMTVLFDVDTRTISIRHGEILKSITLNILKNNSSSVGDVPYIFGKLKEYFLAKIFPGHESARGKLTEPNQEQSYALGQYVLYALSQLCTQSVCALRT